MSDEDPEVDVESEEEDEDGYNSIGGQLSTQFMSPADRRAHHNALERKRRDHIKESFTSLRDAVPALHGEKEHHVAPPSASNNKSVSRAQILKKAADYITFMRRKNHSHQQDIDDLKKHNNVLEQQIKSLEKARTTGQFAVSGAVNARGEAISAFDGGDESSESSEESSVQVAKKFKLSVD